MIMFYINSQKTLLVTWWVVGRESITDAKYRCESYLVGTYSWEHYLDEMSFDAYHTMDASSRTSFDSRDKKEYWHCLVYRKL